MREFLDNEMEARSVFLDISKAFDKVWYEGWLFKLGSIGISEELYNLLERQIQVDLYLDLSFR